MEHLQLKNRYNHLRFTYVPSNLHLTPQKLKDQLQQELNSAQSRDERVTFLYGDCFPGIEDFCRQCGVIKVPGHYCYEMILGPVRFRQLIEEMAGTYFLEKDLILNFEEYCMKPLELHDEEMRKCCFGHYQRLLYVRQPSDPDLAPRASELAEFLSLFLEISDADYSSLEKILIEIIEFGPLKDLSLRTGFPTIKR